MDAKSKKYLEKRKKIIEILKTITSSYETDECYHEISPEFYECLSQSESILKMFGINKPDFLKKEETNTSVLG